LVEETLDELGSELEVIGGEREEGRLGIRESVKDRYRRGGKIGERVDVLVEEGWIGRVSCARAEAGEARPETAEEWNWRRNRGEGRAGDGRME
jgi:hypothetical protein